MEASIAIKYPSPTKTGIGQWIIIIFCLSFCFSQLLTEDVNKYIGHTLWFGWIFNMLIFDLNRTLSILLQKRYFLLYLFAVFYFVSSSLAVGVLVSFNRVIALFEIASPIVMYEYFVKSERKVRIFISVALLGTCIYNVVPLITAINLSGFGLRNVQQGEDAYLRNAYNWAYTWVLISTAVARYLFNGKVFAVRNKFFIILFSIVFLLGCYIVISSLFMTAVICLIIGVALSIVYGRKKWLKKTVVVAVTASLTFIWLFPFILKQTETLFDGTDVMSVRVEEIYLILQGNEESAHDFNSRSNLTKISLRTFINSPFIGINHEIANFETVQYKRIGDHSEWIDDLAKYGLFSLLLFIFLIKTARHNSPETLFVFIVFVIIGFFNPIWYFPPTFSVFFFTPISYSLFLKRDMTELW